MLLLKLKTPANSFGQLSMGTEILWQNCLHGSINSLIPSVTGPAYLSSFLSRKKRKISIKVLLKGCECFLLSPQVSTSMKPEKRLSSWTKMQTCLDGKFAPCQIINLHCACLFLATECVRKRLCKWQESTRQMELGFFWNKWNNDRPHALTGPNAMRWRTQASLPPSSHCAHYQNGHTRTCPTLTGARDAPRPSRSQQSHPLWLRQ